MSYPPDWWTEIEDAYRAGAESLRTTAAAHDISDGAIWARAKKAGWTQNTAATKPQIIADRMAGITQVVTQNVMRNIETARIASFSPWLPR